MRKLRKAPALDELSVLRAELKLLQETNAKLVARCQYLCEANRELSENLTRLATPDKPAYRIQRRGISLTEQIANARINEMRFDLSDPVPDYRQSAEDAARFGDTVRSMSAAAGERDFRAVVDPANRDSRVTTFRSGSNPDQIISLRLHGDEYVGPEDDE